MYSTKCPRCNNNQDLFQKIYILMKSQNKSKFLFECDTCGFTSSVIIYGVDVFYKMSEIVKT